MALPWRDWSEWEEVYAALFALDDDAARRTGLQRVATWRTRGRVPLAVETTATFVELDLSDRARDAAGCALSDHSLSLTYAMALTRLVNGVVDPLQQRARAVSVQKLAAEVALPASLVAVRHEATHNRLPSLPTLRLATEQAMLWLHERYWWPQLQLHRSLPALVGESLRKCQAAVDKRASSRVPRWRVVTCAAQLARKLEPCHARSVLIPMLLDAGFLAPPAGADLPAATAAGAAANHEKVVASMRLWFRLLRQLQQSWPHSHMGGILLVECVRRLATEPEIDPPSAGHDPSAVAGSSTVGDQRLVSRTDVLHACAAYALAQPRPAAGRPHGLRLGRAHLLQAAGLLSRANGGGLGSTALLARAVARPEWPAALLAPTRELLGIRRQADALGARRRHASVGQRVSSWRADVAAHLDPSPAVHVVPVPGGVWGRCERWVAAPIGAPVVLDSRQGPGGMREGGLAQPAGATTDALMGAAGDVSGDATRDMSGSAFGDASGDVSGHTAGSMLSLASTSDAEAGWATCARQVQYGPPLGSGGEEPTARDGQRAGTGADAVHSLAVTVGEGPFEIEPLLALGEAAGARFAR